MNVKMSFTRSTEWVATQKLETGENCCDRALAIFSTQDVSQEARAVLLAAGQGSYRNLAEFRANVKGQWTHSSDYTHGAQNFVPRIDSDTPTVDQINNAILQAELWRKTLAEKHAASVAEQAVAENRRAEARGEIADEIEALTKQIVALEEQVQRFRSRENDLDSDINTLSYFVADMSKQAILDLLTKNLPDAPERDECVKERFAQIEVACAFDIRDEDEDEDAM